jgi:hypothetical protein
LKKKLKKKKLNNFLFVVHLQNLQHIFCFELKWMILKHTQVSENNNNNKKEEKKIYQSSNVL